ncbi:MAG: AAA family ATPase [Coriobacteriales bacterium]|nr:AAA family ATPase [Coriobacteriales bacterium]
MSTYVNPGTDGFANILKDEYVDKTGIIALVNERMERGKGLITVSRPRRFGKTYAAHALAAYYCRGCDSRQLFAELEVSRHPSFERHLNAHDVIRLDMTNALRAAAGGSVPNAVSNMIVPEIKSLWPSVPEGADLVAALLAARDHKGSGFVFIIDEWDAPIREARDAASKREYMEFLRGLFKNGDFTPKCVEMAYLTGILPMVKCGTQSAMSDFDEFTIVSWIPCIRQEIWHGANPQRGGSP